MPPSTAGVGIDRVSVVLVEFAVQAAELLAVEFDDFDEVEALEPEDALSPVLVAFSVVPFELDPESDPESDDPDDDADSEEDEFAPALAGDRLSLR